MTRLIDADKAERDIEELRKSDWFNAPYLTRERKLGLSEAFDMIQGVCIKHAPTVDADSTLREKALLLLVTWAEECGFGYDNFPEEYEMYKDEIKDMGYIDGMIYIAERVVENGTD